MSSSFLSNRVPSRANASRVLVCALLVAGALTSPAALTVSWAAGPAVAGQLAVQPVSGIWTTNSGSYLMLLRDPVGTAVGVEVGTDLKLIRAYVGTVRLRVGVPVLHAEMRSLDGSTAIEFDVGEGALTGTGASAGFSATRLLNYKGSTIDGVWKSDAKDGYQVVFGGEAENGGLAVVADFEAAAGGLTLKQLSLGRIAGGTFLETEKGSFRMFLDEDKLRTAYWSDIEAYYDSKDVATPEQGQAMRVRPATADETCTNCAISTDTTAYQTSSRYLAASDPDARNSRPEPPGGGGSTTTPGCTGDFGALQSKISASMLATLSKDGVAPGTIIKKTFLRDESVFDGGTVPVYEFVYATDTKATVDSTLSKTPAQNLWVTCSISGTTGTVMGQSSTTHSAVASSFCTSIATQVKDLSPKYAAMSMRGMNPKSSTFYPSKNGNEFKLGVTLILDADGTFKSAPSGDTEGYSKVKTKCREWDGKTDVPSDYPKWHSSSPKPTGTPEMALCIDPDRFGVATTPGMFGLDLLHTDSGTKMTATVRVTPTTPAPFQYVAVVDKTNADGSTSQQTIVATMIAMYHEPVVPTANTDTVTTTIKCAYDENAEWWNGYTAGEPHLLMCASLPSTFKSQLDEAAYDGLYVNKTITPSSSSSTSKVTPAWAMASGIGQLSAVSMAALGIGGFAPTGEYTAGSGVFPEVKSSAKFKSIQSYSEVDGKNYCVPVVNPSTGQTSIDPKCNSFVVYTLEAPSCVN